MQSAGIWLWRVGVLTFLSLAIAAFATGCGDDDDNEVSAEETQAVEESVRIAFESSGEQADAFFPRVTDSLLSSVFFSTREECETAPVECIGEPSSVESVSGTQIDGDTATSTAVSDFGTFIVGLVRENGVWKVDSLEAASDEVPEDVVLVDLGLSEFNFIFDQEDIPAGGNLAFHVNNFGAQAHEVVVVSIPEGTEPEEAVVAVAEEIEPPVALKVYIQPGQELDMALEEPLAPGRYALVCFFPDTDDPEFTSHIDKGMAAEFTVE